MQIWTGRPLLVRNFQLTTAPFLVFRILGSVGNGLFAVSTEWEKQTFALTFSSIICRLLLCSDRLHDRFCGRRWFFGKVLELITRNRAVVVRGSAGVGKSAVMAKILFSLPRQRHAPLGLALPSVAHEPFALHADLDVLAFYFCRLYERHTLDVDDFTKWMRKSLERNLAGFVAAEGKEGKDISDSRLKFLHDVWEPLKKCTPNFTAVAHVIIVDGLDESLACDSAKVRLRFGQGVILL